MTKKEEEVIEAPVAPQLTLQDIQVYVALIDRCSKEGVFAGEELAAVGAVRARIVAFLQYQQAQQNDNG